MSNENRHRHEGLVELMDADSGTVIEVGDMLYYATDDVRPASAFTWNTDLATTQAGFKDVFVGIALTAKPAGAAGKVTVMTRGVFEMESPSTAWQYGALVGADKASGNALLSQTVETAVAASAVGIVRDTGTKTRVRVYFDSQFLNGVKVGE